jgi:hypothetical protein
MKNICDARIVKYVETSVWIGQGYMYSFAYQFFVKSVQMGKPGDINRNYLTSVSYCCIFYCLKSLCEYSVDKLVLNLLST